MQQLAPDLLASLIRWMSKPGKTDPRFQVEDIANVAEVMENVQRGNITV